MTEIAILLIVVSSFTHAGWNLLVKNTRSTAGSFLLSNLTGGLLLLPAALIFRRIVAQMPPVVFLLLLLTGLFQALYYASLARAYRHGDLSLIYPLARALPILLVSLATLLLGRGGRLSPLSLTGFGAIVVGAVLLPLRSFGELRPRRYLRPATVLALLAAVGTAGYSIVDSGALGQLRSAVAGASTGGPAAFRAAAWKVPVVYSFFEAISSALWLGVFLLTRRSGRRELLRLCSRRAVGSSIMTGIGIYLTYTLVLISMGFVSNVAYVVAFRQLSIPIGVLFGILLLREPALPPRLVGTAVMVGGLLLTSLG